MKFPVIFLSVAILFGAISHPLSASTAAAVRPQKELDDYFAATLAGKVARLADVPATVAELDALRAKLFASYSAAAKAATAGQFRDPISLNRGDVKLATGEFRISEGLTMPYFLFSRGERPEGGWPLVIAMHGGGGTSEKLSGPHGWSVNTREWQVQTSFASKRYPDNALYFVPRMVDDNNGRWWRDFNVLAFEALIRHSIVNFDVDPDRVYMLGISEGGYGTEVLATRLSDRLAAVSAMACGSGSSIHVENLRNLPYRTDVGERDTAFGRVANARKNHETLEKLRQHDEDGYTNLLNVQKGRGHGIDYFKGPVWMFQHTRRTHPARVVLTTYRADKKRNDSAFWLQITSALGHRDVYLDARIDAKHNVIDIKAEATKEDGQYQSPDWQQSLTDPGELVPATGLGLRLWLHESLIDFARPVIVRINGKEVMNGTVTPGLAAMAASLARLGDPKRIAPAFLDVKVN